MVIASSSWICYVYHLGDKTGPEISITALVGKAPILLGSSLILSLITIIGVVVLPDVFGLAKAEKNIS